MSSFSLIVPCYNEEGSLPWFIPQLAAQIAHIPELEILVVDDGSRDRSPLLLQELALKYPIRVITNPVNLGLGGAMRRGFNEARGEWLTYLPADGQVPAAELRRFLPYMDRYDLIISRRPTPPDYTRYRRLASRVYTAWVSLAFGLRLRDFNWVQAWKRSYWQAYGSDSNSVFVCGEFLVRCRRVRPRMVEIEIAYRPRSAGRAKNGSPRAALRAAADITRVFFEETRAGRFHFLDPVWPDRAQPEPGTIERRKAA